MNILHVSSPRLSAIALVASLLLLACEPNKEPLPAQQPEVEKPSSGTAVVTNPNKPADGEPIMGTRRLQQIKFADTDFQELSYSKQGLLVRYKSQYLYVMGTDKVRSTVADFIYDTNNRLVRLNLSHGGYVTYTYDGNIFPVKSEEFNALGQVTGTHTYRYSPKNQLIESLDLSRLNNTDTRRTYEYDPAGNLSAQREYVKTSGGAYDLQLSIHFENYDTKKHVENAVAIYPYLPAVTFRYNNPGVRILRGKNGQELQPRQYYSYTYDAGGYPLSKQINTQGSTLNAAFTYSADK